MERREIQKYTRLALRPLMILAILALPYLPLSQAETISAEEMLQNPPTYLEELRNNYLSLPIVIQTAVPQTTVEEEKAPEEPSLNIGAFRLTNLKVQGVAGYYSRDGCIGCSDNMTMSNGRPLDDDALTLAASPVIPQGPVLVRNLDNDRSVIAQVTDRGGFGRYDRVADLTRATKNAIEGTDLTNVEITVLEPTPAYSR